MSEKISDSFFSMGTEISLDIVVRSKSEKKRAYENFQAARDIFARFEGMFSRFSSVSELMLLNGQIGTPVDVSPEMFDVLRLCVRFYRETEGIFDPRVLATMKASGYSESFWSPNARVFSAFDPTVFEKPLTESLILDKRRQRALLFDPVDVSGLVKGYTVERVSNVFKNEDFQGFIVDAGGDMFVSGRNDEDDSWRVAVEGVSEENLLVSLSNLAIATSGRTRRFWEKNGKMYHHIVHPRRPDSFSFDLKTATVIAKNVIEADVWAKSFFLIGKEDGLKRAEDLSIPVLFLDNNNQAYASRSFSSYATVE